MRVSLEKEISKSVDRIPVLIGVEEGGPTKSLRWTPEEGEDDQGKMKLQNQEERVFP